jgi:fibronectin type 3 domain-containing protein
MGKVRNVVFYLSLSLCCFCAITLVKCKINSNNPSDYQPEQTKLTVTVPADVDADIYRVSVLVEGSDTIIYYENAKSNDIQVSVPSMEASQIIVDAYKNGSTIFSGSATVAAGNQKPIAILKNEFIELLPPAEILTRITAENLVSLSWPACANATSYRIYRTTDTLEAPIEVGVVSELAWTDSDVSIGTIYYYRVVVQNESSESSPSAYWGILVTDQQQGAPQAPVGVTAAATSESKIRVTWDAVELASEYKVQWSTQSSGPFESENTTSEVLEVSSLLPSTAYFFNVIAINSSGQSAPSVTVTSTTSNIVIAIPQTPSGVQGTGISENSIQISWTTVQNATKYKVQWSTQSGGTFTSADVEVNSYVIGTLVPSTTYYCKVSAINSSGQSDASSTITVKTLDPAVQVPQAPVLTVAALSDTSIQISWGSVSNAASYIIERATVSSGPFAAVCTTASTSKIDTKLNSSTSYFYRGKAINSAGGSSYSPTVSATTALSLLPPSGLTAGTITESSIIVKWQAATGAESYKIYSSGTENGTYQVRAPRQRHNTL